MKRVNHTFFTLFIFLPLFFSCSHKGGNGSTTKDTSKPKADTTIDSAAIKAAKEKNSRATSWEVNEQASKVSFTIKNFGSDVHGTLGGLNGAIHFDEKNLKASSFEASVKVSTINTGTAKRDRDLMGDKYFDELNHHEITFKSDTIIASGKAYKVIGMLVIKGKALRKEIPFTFEQKGNSGIFKSDFTLQRLDYGVGGTGPIMGKDVNVSLEVVAQKQ